MNLVYEIGQTVYWAKYVLKTYNVMCPDCFGKKRLTCITGSGRKLFIACSTCEDRSNGFEPTGLVSRTQYEIEIVEATITGIEVGRDKVEYKLSGGYIVDDNQIAATREQAVAKGKLLQEEANLSAYRDFYNKERPTKTWARNVTYHRREIKRLTRELAYHQSKLGIAQKKTKQ